MTGTGRFLIRNFHFLEKTNVPRFFFVDLTQIESIKRLQNQSNIYRGQNGSGDAKADGQWCRSFDIFAIVIAHAKHDQHQSEGGKEFNAETLCRCQLRVHFGHAQRIVERGRRQSL